MLLLSLLFHDGSLTGNQQPGDWICLKCNYLNWRRRKVCQTCLPCELPRSHRSFVTGLLIIFRCRRQWGFSLRCCTGRAHYFVNICPFSNLLPASQYSAISSQSFSFPDTPSDSTTFQQRSHFSRAWTSHKIRCRSRRTIFAIKAHIPNIWSPPTFPSVYNGIILDSTIEHLCSVTSLFSS